MAENVEMDADDYIDEGKENAFIEAFYAKVNGLVGGDNPDEHLCLMVPGISLNKEDYAFNKVKSPTVEANESRLVNKLYDPYNLVNSDNGRTLPNQYLSALNLLTPKLNTVIAKAKNELRKLLMKKYPYTFVYADGTKEYRSNSTFQEVYFYLYSEYLDTMQKWAKKQTEQIAKLGRGTDEYLEWYQNNAEVELNIINQKRAKLMAMFSPNDMKILEGVLDSGSGAELQEARQLMNNLKKMNPDGSYTYPVTLYPSDWHKYLDTSFTPVDLLQAPEKLADELRVLAFRKNALLGQIEAISEQIPDSTDVESKCKAARDAEKACDDAFASMALTGEQAGFDFIVTTVKSVCNVCNAFNKVDPAKVGKENASETEKQKAEKSCNQAKTIADKILINNGDDDENQEDAGKSILDTVKESATKILGSLLSNDSSGIIQKLNENKIGKELVNALKSKLGVGSGTSADATVTNLLKQGKTSEAAAEGAVKDIANEVLNKTNGLTVAGAVSQVVGEVFSEVQKEAAAVDSAQNKLIGAIDTYLNTQSEAADLENRSQLKSSLRMLNTQLKDVESQINNLYTDLMISSNNKESSGVEPPVVPEGFTQFVLTHKMSESTEHSEKTVTTSTSSKKTGCWIFKKTRKTTTYDAQFQKDCFSSETEIAIGMNVAKVAIEREWFNPGVFLLSQDMYRLGSVKISSGAKSFEVDSNEEDSGNASSEVFPCYSTALLIARDVTIKIKNSSSSFSTASRTSVSKTAKSRSFFVFHTGDGSSTRTETNDSTSKFEGDTMTMRFATPQVIGVYLHTVPEDNSKEYKDNVADKDNMIITEFVKTYKAILDEYIADEQDTEKV